VRRLWLSVTTVAPLAAILWGPFALYQVAIRDVGSWLFIGPFMVWVAGILGVTGLWQCILRPDDAGHAKRGIVTLLLFAGILAAVMTAWFLTLSEWSGPTDGSRWSKWQNWLVLVVLSINPMLAAVNEIIQLRDKRFDCQPPDKSLHEPSGVSVTRLADATRAPETGVPELRR
jgi:hypothetical protein